MKVLISQSNYIPWKGFFESLKNTDLYVLYDEMQYTRNDWRNRNKIKTAQGLQWMTIPVAVKTRSQTINETLLVDSKWKKKHLTMLSHSYSKAPSSKEVLPWIKEVYELAPDTNISEVNLHFLKEICAYLEIDFKYRRSSEFTLHEDRNERLANIAKEVGATEYWSGPAAKAYLDHAPFDKHNIEVKYFHFDGMKEYPQLHPPFEHGVSILDLLFHMGKDSKKFLR